MVFYFIDGRHHAVGHGVKCFCIIGVGLAEVAETFHVLLFRLDVRTLIVSLGVASVSCLTTSGASGTIPCRDLFTEERLEIGSRVFGLGLLVPVLKFVGEESGVADDQFTSVDVFKVLLWLAEKSGKDSGIFDLPDDTGKISSRGVPFGDHSLIIRGDVIRVRLPVHVEQRVEPDEEDLGWCYPDEIGEGAF